MGNCGGPDCWYDCKTCRAEKGSTLVPSVVKEATMKIGNLVFTEEIGFATWMVALALDKPRIQVQLEKNQGGWVGVVMVSGAPCLTPTEAVRSAVVTAADGSAGLYDVCETFRDSLLPRITCLGVDYCQEGLDGVWHREGPSDVLPRFLYWREGGWRNEEEGEVFQTPKAACLAWAKTSLKKSEEYMIGLRAEVAAVMAQAGVK